MTLLPGASRRLPARLLDLGGGSIRLHTTNGMDVATRYVALSFMWGSATALDRVARTFTANVEAFSHHIDGLPTTFADAIAVTLQLGIRYLWIDSLCIIQDDIGDFSAERGNVENIFSNAYCVIAASSASSALGVGDGLRRPRRSRAVVPLGSTDGLPIAICEMIDNFESDVEASPLSRRAWAFQEHIFSRRTIFFTSSQIYWQCGEEICCETLTRLVPRYVSCGSGGTPTAKTELTW
jgi:hypothetical protein